jgi:hypothetical protein
LFAGGESRWLAVLAHAPGVSEQPRVLLVSVPYAMQAANADTVGGLPATAFVRADTAAANAATAMSAVRDLSVAANVCRIPYRAYLGTGSSTGGSDGFVVAGTNLDPSAGYSLSFLGNSGTLLEGWNRSAGGGEIDLISNRGGGATGGFALYDYTNGGALNQLATFQGDGKVGIGTGAPDQMLTVNGAVHSMAGGFVFPDGSVLSSAVAVASTQSSGNVVFTAGSGTGSSGNIALQTAGNATNVSASRLVIAGAPKAMTGAVPTANLFSIHIAQGDAAGGRVKFTIVASDGTHYAMETGEMIYLMSPLQATCSMVISQYAAAPPAYTNTTLAIPQIGQAGALNAQCNPASFGSDWGVQIFDIAPTTFTPTTHKVYYTIENQSQSAITLQP